MLRTKDRCTPRPLWVPAQSRQSVMPYVREHHDGFGVEHSAQMELPASERRVACCACVRGADFDMVREGRLFRSHNYLSVYLM